jgi:hypothetical protein
MEIEGLTLIGIAAYEYKQVAVLTKNTGGKHGIHARAR